MPALQHLPNLMIRHVDRMISEGRGDNLPAEVIAAYTAQTGKVVPSSQEPLPAPVVPFAEKVNNIGTASPARRRPTRIAQQIAQEGRSRGFLKLQRSTFTETLMRDSPAFMLLLLIAWRAWRSEEPNLDGLVFGQAFIGDIDSIGLTRQQYRSAAIRLEKWRLATFVPSNLGTIATLTNSKVFSLIDERDSAKCHHQSSQHNNQQLPLGDLQNSAGRETTDSTNGQPAPNQQPTTNENGRRLREVESIAPAKPTRKRNALIDTLAAVDGSDLAQVTGKAWGAAAAALKEICEVCPKVTPDEIKRRASNYHLHMPPDNTISANALAKHWAKCDRGPQTGQPGQQPAREYLLMNQ